MRTLSILAALLLAACSPQPAVTAGTVPDLDGAFEFASLDIINDNGETLTFDVYLAVNPEFPDTQELVTALALLLVIEGLLPFIAPGFWQKTMRELSAVNPNIIRVGGIISMLAGAFLLQFLH